MKLNNNIDIDAVIINALRQQYRAVSNINVSNNPMQQENKNKELDELNYVIRRIKEEKIDIIEYT